MMRVLYRRADGTFVIELGGLPYHVLPADPLFAEVSVAGQSAPLEPTPSPLTPAPRPPRYSKSAIIEALTQEEAAVFEAGLIAATPQLRLIWNGAPDLMNGENAAWATFEALFSEGLGPSRAAEILTAARV